MEPYDAVHLGGQALIVSGNQGGAALAANQAKEFSEDRVGGMLIEISGRLVGKHERRFVRKGAGNRNPLLLAAGQLGGSMVKALGKTERAEQLLCAYSRGLRLGAEDELWQHHILDGIELGQQVMELIHEAEELAPEPRSSVIVEPRCFLAAQPDRALKAPLEQANRLEEGGFARS